MFSVSAHFLLIYGTVLGFVMAGVAACAVEYTTARELKFDIAPGNGLIGGLCGFLIRLIAGPYLVARFLHHVATTEFQPLLVSVGSLLVIAWSLSLGIMIITSLMI